MTNITVKIPLDLQLQMALLRKQRIPLPNNHPTPQLEAPPTAISLSNIRLFHSGEQIHVLQINGHHVQQALLASAVFHGTYRAQVAGQFEVIRDEEPAEIGH